LASDSLQPVSDIAALTTADGRFRFSNIEPGSYTVSVHSGALPPGEASGTVLDGQQTEVEVRLGAAPPVASDASAPDAVAPETGTVLEVSLLTHAINWSLVRMVRVSLQYADPDHGIAVANEFFFSVAASGSKVWTVQLADASRDQYDGRVVFFMASGQQKGLNLEGEDARTLLLVPPD
jgi:hypothetical protein